MYVSIYFVLCVYILCVQINGIDMRAALVWVDIIFLVSPCLKSITFNYFSDVYNGHYY